MLHFAALQGDLVPFVRSIGRWAMTALVINCIIGSGIYGLPSDVAHMLGRKSPVAMIVAGLAMATILVSYAEVASRFSGAGGSYLYVRTAFGRFAGLQVGWFWLLSVVGAAAASANLFVTNLAALVPGADHGLPRVLAMAALIAVPVAANYFGARSGAALSSVLTVAKTLPLLLLIVLGLAHFHSHGAVAFALPAAPSWRIWLYACVLVVWAYSGCEDSVVPAGEVKDARKNVPLALLTGLVTVIAIYTLIQFVAVATIGGASSDRPLSDVASILIGRGGATFVEIAVMLSTYGYISAAILNAPRLPSAFAAHGDCPASFGELHPRFHTPSVAVLIFGAIVWVLALTGTFRWALILSVASSTIYYATVCASLIRLRRLRPAEDSLRIPLGPLWAALGVGVSLALLTQIDWVDAALMSVTAVIAAANWWWASRRPAAPPVAAPADV
jgi:basic amino acid/polyamine antiporter, APA family